eukprot:CAMPEP_0185902558 /NCGR_PEP_ID=MMETSP0196C-20130402/1796_1 /TAXON_ID=2932 /ORGANISM="Alexandrium fundyense, Strain CCMP1719" /LENGTH=47 /DNA_ID= /DNA_START= /DNA_END= /DNA_ORIENTATION=
MKPSKSTSPPKCDHGSSSATRNASMTKSLPPLLVTLKASTQELKILK